MKKTVFGLLVVLTLFSVFFIGSAYASWDSDYKRWSQVQTDYSDQDSAMREYGCCVVAQARMLYEMGINQEASFNPDRYLEWEIQNGYVANIHHIEQLSFDGPVAYAAQRGKEITYFGDNWDTSDDQIWFNINAGYWTIVNVGNHYILVDNATSLTSIAISLPFCFIV